MWARHRANVAANPGFGRLMGAQGPADFADWLDFVAVIALLAYAWDAPPIAFASFAVAMGLPYVTVGLIAGALVDRLDLRRVMIASNLGRAVATLALAFAPTWPVLVAILFLRACADTFYAPAKQAALQALVRPDDLLWANGVSHGINQMSKVAAPGLGGLLIVFTSAQGVFFINAAVSLLAVAVIWQMPPVARKGAPEASDGLWSDLAAGLALLRQSPLLKAAMALMAAGYFAMFFYDTLFAPLIAAFGHDAQVLGLTLAAVGSGGVVASFALSAPVGIRRAFVMIGVTTAVNASLIGLLGGIEVAGHALSVPALLAICVVLGATSVMVLVPNRALIQIGCPPGSMGRISSLSEAVNTLALLTAPFLGAALATATSVGAAYIGGAGLMMLAALGAGLLAQRFRGV